MLYAGSRGDRLRMASSPWTLLRIIRRTVDDPIATRRALEVDDFARPQGHIYGTSLVEVDQHSPIGLLSGRTANTMPNRLKALSGCRHGGPPIVQGSACSVPYITCAISTPRTWSMMVSTWQPFASTWDTKTFARPSVMLSQPTQRGMLNSESGAANGNPVPDTSSLRNFGLHYFRAEEGNVA